MPNDDARSPAERLMADYMERAEHQRGIPMGDSTPFLTRAAQVAQVVQTEHLARIATALTPESDDEDVPWFRKPLTLTLGEDGKLAVSDPGLGGTVTVLNPGEGYHSRFPGEMVARITWEHE